MARALYPGSFDPVTFGHLDLVDRAMRLFDSVTVAAAENITKQPVFSLAERLDLLKQVLPAKVEVSTFRGLVVDHCRTHGYDLIIRGLRTMSDFEYEYQMAMTNRHLNPHVETVFVMPSLQFSYVSSSLIKDVVRNGGDVSAYLPPAVDKALRSKLQQ